jgi:MFS family permease
MPTVSKGYARYALWLLMIIYTFNFLDRQVINILAEPIKNDLGLEDWQLGMLTGLAFAFLYTVLGIPIARIAERKNRPVIIATSVVAWSVFTAVCGAAQTFWQLVLARIGVGIGEAGCTPPAHSLISDYVPKEKRASAIAFYSIGTPLGALLGMSLGGIIADAYGWRWAFFIAGAPGLLLGVLVFFTLVEPRKKLAAELAAKSQAAVAGPTFVAVLKVLKSKKTFWLLAFGVAVKAFIGYGQQPFIASFFLRVHKDQLAQLAAKASDIVGFEVGVLTFVALMLSGLSGIGGIFGVWLGGFLADRMGAKDIRAYALVPALAAILPIPFYVFGILHHDALFALLFLVVPAVLTSLWYGPVYGTAQSIVPPAMRATTAAILLLVANLIGLGLGPLIVGVLSTFFDKGLGMGSAEGIRWALVASAVMGLVAFGLFWAARKTIKDDIVS